MKKLIILFGFGSALEHLTACGLRPYQFYDQDTTNDVPVHSEPDLSDILEVSDSLDADFVDVVNDTPDEFVDAPVVIRPMQISAGGEHTCALMSNSTVQCWGRNSSGQLGVGDTIDRLTPSVVVGLTGVERVVTGHQHSCALRTDRTLVCWGANASGQLGDGTMIDRTSPVRVSSTTGLVEVISVATGSNHTCARLLNGTLLCWGSNARGQLGVNDGMDHSTPVIVTGASGSSLQTGAHHSCVSSFSGVMCWGGNNFGQIGDGTTMDRSSPVTIVGLNGVTKLVTGGYFTCALRSGSVGCWGGNSFGQLGIGNTTQQTAFTPVMGLNNITDIYAGGDHACAVSQSGVVSCWGWNITGQLGTGTTLPNNQTTPIQTLVSAPSAMTLGGAHSCSMDGTNQVFCWGNNRHGQVGDGTTTNRTSPAMIQFVQ